MTTAVTMKFDLEDRLDGVMESVEAKGIMGTAGGSLAYTLNGARNGGIYGRTRRRKAHRRSSFFIYFWPCFVIGG